MMEFGYQSEEIGELAAALAQAQAGFKFAVKDSEAPLFEKGGVSKGKRKYADLQSVLDAVRTGLAENGLAVIQAPMPSADGVKLRTTLAHKSGQWMSSELCLPNDRMGGVQGMGSALTYARRYALAAMVGIAQDDDDGETAMRESKAAAKERVQRTRDQAKAENPSPPHNALRKAMFETLRERGFTSLESMKGELSNFFGREIETTNVLTAEEIHEYLNACDSTKAEAMNA